MPIPCFVLTSPDPFSTVAFDMASIRLSGEYYARGSLSGCLPLRLYESSVSPYAVQMVRQLSILSILDLSLDRKFVDDQEQA